MSASSVETKMNCSPTQLKIADNFKSFGVTREAFLSVTLTPAQLQAYLTSIAPFEVFNTPKEKTDWDAALVKNEEMMKSIVNPPLLQTTTTEAPIVKTISEK